MAPFILARPVPVRRLGGLLADYLKHPTGLHVIDGPRNGDVVRDQLGASQRLNIVENALLKIRKWKKVDSGRIRAEVCADLRNEVVIAKGQHSAVGVMYDHNFLRAEQPLGDPKRPNGIVGCASARVADYVR